MDEKRIIRAWKDPGFRARLSSEERAELPECPSGEPLTELDEDALVEALGGRTPRTLPLRSCMYVCMSVDICTA